MGKGTFDPETMKNLSVGFDDFESVINKNLYYVDKTLMIKDCMVKVGRVVC